ncbi:MAG TPA: hypothetical protein VFK30_01215, partial [Anaerolineae bacterium]|nr:hypothetical protein [Anaerolineae bacterium]
RYLIPMIPFMVWPLAATLDRIEHVQSRIRHLLWLITFSLIAVSILITWSLTVGGQYYTPEEIQNPLIEYSWPHILAGDVARNMGMLFGLRGAASVIPLLLLAVITFGLIWRSTHPAMKEIHE